MPCLAPTLARCALITLALTACSDSPSDVVVGGSYQRVLDPPPAPITALDVLVVVDSSASMRDENEALITHAGDQLFAQIAVDLGGMLDLHLAVISPDVGTGLAGTVAGCSSSGDDGHFLLGGPDRPCTAVDGRYLVHSARDGNNYRGSLSEAFRCMASVGTQGCGFEQPLEATRRALDGRHADHAGFLRPDALLLVLYLTDEDDCSAQPALFDPTDMTFGDLRSFRCFQAAVVCDPDDPTTVGAKTGCRSRDDGEVATAIDDIATFLRGQKSDAGLVMVAGMYGPPTPVAVELTDGGDDVQLASSCAGAAVTATPAIRLDALVQQFPARLVFDSICDLPMTARLQRIARSTGGVMAGRPCLLAGRGTSVSADTCRGLAVSADASTTALRSCRDGSDTGCVVIAADPVCSYTATGLAATYRGALAAGQRLAVECATD